VQVREWVSSSINLVLITLTFRPTAFGGLDGNRTRTSQETVVRPKPLDHGAKISRLFNVVPHDETLLMTWLHQDHWLREVGSNHRVFRLTVGCLTAWLPRNGIPGKCSSDGSLEWITVNLRPKNSGCSCQNLDRVKHVLRTGKF
jgi:hypothetical protein